MSPPAKLVPCVLLLLIAAGCGGDGGATGTGGAGAGRGGTSGTAGTGGTADAGTSGTGGGAVGGSTAGSAGTTGSAGSSGTTGAAGAAGAAGTGTGGSAGSAGSAGSSGTTGGAGGRGGTGGGAGTGGAAGRGGSSGAGAVAGAGGRGGGAGTGGGGGTSAASALEALQRSYIDLRFGMFIHFGILTYTGSWSQANLPINMFNPVNLNPGQWADAAVGAKMKYGVLTTRHHDGFALWPSAVGNFSVRNIPWRSGQGDVVKEFADAFRARNLRVGLYYSVWDNTQGTGNGTVTRAQIDYVKTQLTELLTNYGAIDILVFDGWSWKMGHKTMPYQEIRELVKSIQPSCLLLDHTHFMSPWDADVAAIEEPKGAFVPADNTFPATQGQKINSGGNDWFWSTSLGTLMSADNIVNGHLRMLEPRWTNFLLNCPPNRDGVMDTAIVARLAEVGAMWSPNASRAPLPAQGPQNEYPYTPASAAATSGTAANAIDGVNDYGAYTIWQSTASLPQSVTIDLGQSRPDVGYLGYVPRYVANSGPSTDGAITQYAILTSTNNTTFTMATTGTWPVDGKMKAVAFGPVAARFVRLEARAVNGSNGAVATEITVGARR